MNAKFKVFLTVIAIIFCIIGVAETFTSIYDNFIREEYKREIDEYFDGYRGGARSFYRMDSAVNDTEEFGTEVDYKFAEDLAVESLLRNYPESKDWDSNYYDGFKDGYIAKYVQEYYRGY